MVILCRPWGNMYLNHIASFNFLGKWNAIMKVGNVLVSLVLFMWFFLPTSSTIEINFSDVSLFKLTNIFAGQDYTSKQRKTDDFLFYNRPTWDVFISMLTLWLVLAESGACEGSSCPGRYYTTLTL